MAEINKNSEDYNAGYDKGWRDADDQDAPKRRRLECLNYANTPERGMDSSRVIEAAEAYMKFVEGK